MTRINVIDCNILTNKHLVAEYHEIQRLPNTLKKSLNTRGIENTIKEIPLEYVLGKGHVKFFWNKKDFIYNRFLELQKEMISRGFKINYENKFDPEKIYDKIPNIIYEPNGNDISINIERINLRLFESSQKRRKANNGTSDSK